MSISYRPDSPNTKPAGKRLLSTVELLRKKAALGVELADLGIKAAEARAAGDTGTYRDLCCARAELRRRIAVIDVRLSERIISV